MYIDGQNKSVKISAEIILANKRLVGVCNARFFKMIFNNNKFPMRPHKMMGNKINDLYVISPIGLMVHILFGKSYSLKLG